MAMLGGLTDAIGITNNSQSEAAMNAAMGMMSAVQLPELSPIQLQQLVSSGEFTPEQAQAYQLQQSKMQDVYVDPKLKQAQMLALQNLQDIGANGMTAEDRAKLSQIQTQEDTALRGQREALAQNAAMRGMGGSGIDLMNQQMATQEGANRIAARDTDVAAQSQQAKMQALQQAGQLAGNMSSQDWQQQAAKAQAADAINQFNTQNRQQVSMANVGTRNQANAQNLAERQRLSDANVQLANQSRQYNASIPQQQFQNALGKAGGMANLYGNQANMYQQQGAQNMQTLGGLAMAGALMYKSDINAKENIQKGDLDIDQFLNDITGYKYNYKNPQDGQGERLGVMAQDMEKSAMGQETVMDGPDGKQIDMKKALAASLASLARLNERLNALEGR
jgi:hypothetical protein